MTTRVIDTDEREEEREDDERWIDSESSGRGGWDDDGDDVTIPPRPRGRLLRPLPLALIALIIAAAGFLGGIEAQKGSEGGSGATAGLGGGGLPNFAALKEGRSAAGGSESKGSESGVPSFGGSSAAATGTVTSVEGHTIYVKESDGTTVAVTVGDGATVTRDSNVATKKIHPGDTVTVEGSKHGSTVRASSVSATESGVEATTTGPGATATSGGSESETSVESLFEE
ncbi:MAG: hypothetical protein JWO14_3619 [Solirubrobacterales bacterium]|nr:hypothetical protein [Solirubrobacterales bacterium]